MSNIKIYQRRFLIILATSAIIIFVLNIYFYTFSHFKTENIDEHFRWSEERKESYFSEAFPSRHEIEDYLFNSTFLTSKPPIGNDVTYFNANGCFFDWHGNEIKRGNWSLYPIVYRRIYKGKSRIDIIYSLCRELDDGSLTDDNCYLVGRHNMYWRSGQIDYEKGDIFNLSGRKMAPFDLPETSISVEQMKTAINR
jgi:hypothetical protein